MLETATGIGKDGVGDCGSAHLDSTQGGEVPRLFRRLRSKGTFYQMQ